jgi:hypothetical protein
MGVLARVARWPCWGPIPRDQIVTHAGERFEKYGCALYTAVALSALLDPGDTIVPIAHVRRRDEGPIKEILGAYRNVDTSGITSSHDQGTSSSCATSSTTDASSGRRVS